MDAAAAWIRDRGGPRDGCWVLGVQMATVNYLQVHTSYPRRDRWGAWSVRII